jgi:hypothetical protein
MKLQLWCFAKLSQLSIACIGLLAIIAFSYPVAAQSPAVFKGIRIDVSGMPVGAVEARRDIQSCLARALPQAFAGRIEPGSRSAPVLTVRPISIWLGSSSTSAINEEFSRSDNGNSIDSMEGEALAGNLRVPLMVSANSDFGSIGAPEQNARLRTNTLCSNFALWLARKI